MFQVFRTIGIFTLILGLSGLVPTIAAAKEKSQKVIDFEDEVVEGLNKQPLDSLSEIGQRDKKRQKPHLYRKREGFRSEIAETLHNIHFTP